MIAFLSICAMHVSAQQNASVFNQGTFFKSFTSKTQKVKDINMHYVIGGKGPVIVLIHGWPECWYEWRKMMPPLALHYTVISVDLRGAGESTATAGGYDKKTLAGDVHQLLAQLGYKKYVVVGHDWGASVAYALAAQFPEQVSHLIVAEGIPFGKWLPSVELYWYFGFIRAKGNYAERVTEGHERAFLNYFYQSSPMHYVKGAINNADVNYYLRYFMQPGRMTAGFNFYRTIEQDVRDNNIWAVHPLQMPVLAIGGDVQAKDEVAKVMRNVAGNVKQIVMKNTGHFIAEERPAEFVTVITDFIRQ